MMHTLYSLDANVWFILTANLFNVIVCFKLPKQFPTSVTVLIMLFGLIMAKSADFILGTQEYDLYDMNNLSDKLDLIDLFLTAIYPPFSYYFLYIYKIRKFKGFSLFSYIVIVALLSVGFEYLADLANVFQYKGWKLSYSFPVYLISLGLSLVFYRVIVKKVPTALF